MESTRLIDSGCLVAEGPDSFFITVYVQPRSSKNAVVGIHGQAVKLRLTSPPVDGKANAQALGYLAKLFGVTKASIAICSGMQSRNKRFLVKGLNINKATELLEGLLSGK